MPSFQRHSDHVTKWDDLDPKRWAWGSLGGNPPTPVFGLITPIINWMWLFCQWFLQCKPFCLWQFHQKWPFDQSWPCHHMRQFCQKMVALPKVAFSPKCGHLVGFSTGLGAKFVETGVWGWFPVLNLTYFSRNTCHKVFCNPMTNLVSDELYFTPLKGCENLTSQL